MTGTLTILSLLDLAQNHPSGARAPTPAAEPVRTTVTESPSWIYELATRNPEGFCAFLAIASIAFAVAAYNIVKLWASHRERLAMIERGSSPDGLEGESSRRA